MDDSPEEEFLSLNDLRIRKSSVNEDVLIMKEILVQEKLTDSIL